ncbi:hypothetical protein [Paenibacillus sp. FSL P2-0136]|uniref:hypothetical protein n=1 Tax=Paenibacillus sp. FSL P2-0136 TaxID=2975317 RepID=UPI0030DD787D
MAFFSNKIKINQLFGFLVTNLKSINDDSWSVVFESTSMLVVKSAGSSGSEKMFLKLEPDTSKNATGNSIKITISDNMSTTDGSIPPPSIAISRVFTFHSTIVDTNGLIDYNMSVLVDRIVLWVSGDVNSTTGVSNMAFIGLINQYSTGTPAANAFSIGLSYRSNEDGFRAVKDVSGGTASSLYKAYSTLVPTNPGPAGAYNVYPQVLANAVEGARGELPDIYHVPPVGVNLGDIINVGGKAYTVYSLSPQTTSSTQFNNFTGTKVAVYMG